MTTNNAISIRDLIARERLAIDQNTKSHPGKPGRVIRVNPLDVRIDHSYQRNLNRPHATKIGQEFQFANMKIPNGFLHADGTVLITDGQHTCTGAALNGIPEIDVYVIEMPATATAQAQVSQQSQQFLSINRNQKPVSKYDIYRNELIQGDPTVVAIDAVCRKLGVVPCANSKTYKTRPGHLSHIHNLKNCWSQIGAAPTEEALAFMRKYWPNDAIDGAVFAGLARFFQKLGSAQRSNLQNSDVNLSELALALKTTSNFTLSQVDEAVLVPLFGQTGAAAGTAADVWRARAIRIAYNQFVGNTRALPRIV